MKPVTGRILTPLPWARLAIWVALASLALAAVPRFVSAVGAVGGLVAVAFGVIALRRGGRSVLATSATGLGVLAVVLGIALTFVYYPAPPKWEPEVAEYYADHTDTVLADQLTVAFGEPHPGTAFGRKAAFQLPVTLTNRLDEARTYSLQIVALEGDVQLATSAVSETLAPHQTMQTTAFDLVEATPAGKDVGLRRLRAATYKVLQADSSVVGKGR